MSMQAIKVGESPEGSQAGKEGTPSICMRLIHEAMPRGEVPTRWINIEIIKHGAEVNLGII